MGAAYSLLMLSSSLRLQILTAVVFLIYRAHVFAFPSAFAGHVFGSRTVGRITGMMFTLCSPVQFLLSPALSVTLHTFNNDFRPLNLIQLVVLVPISIFAVVLMKRTQEPSIPLPTRYLNPRMRRIVHYLGSSLVSRDYDYDSDSSYEVHAHYSGALTPDLSFRDGHERRRHSRSAPGADPEGRLVLPTGPFEMESGVQMKLLHVQQQQQPYGYGATTNVGSTVDEPAAWSSGYI